jgi:hypothetical protein
MLSAVAYDKPSALHCTSKFFVLVSEAVIHCSCTLFLSATCLAVKLVSSKGSRTLEIKNKGAALV